MARPATKHPAEVIELTTRQVANIRAAQAQKTSKVLGRITAFALGEEFEGKKVKMTSQELKAAEIHLRKTCPDLSAMVVMDGGNDFDHLSREDLIERVAGMIRANPMLAQASQLLGAVSEQAVVAEVIPISEDD